MGMAAAGYRTSLPVTRGTSAGSNTTTALQDRELALIEKAGGKALIINEDNTDLIEVWCKTVAGENK